MLQTGAPHLTERSPFVFHFDAFPTDPLIKHGLSPIRGLPLLQLISYVLPVHLSPVAADEVSTISDWTMLMLSGFFPSMLWRCCASGPVTSVRTARTPLEVIVLGCCYTRANSLI